MKFTNLNGYEKCLTKFAHFVFNLVSLYLFISTIFRQRSGAQFSEAGLNGALFNINLHINNILQNTKFQITKVLT